MTWNTTLLGEAQGDLRKLNGPIRTQVPKGIQRASQNSLPATQDGHGKPLGNKDGTNLTDLLEIKSRDLGIRVAYEVEIIGSIMNITIISTRTDEQACEKVKTRRNEHHL